LCIFFINIFFFVFIGSVIPDIRDIKGDREAGVVTLPVIYGVGKTVYLLLAINTIATVVFYIATFLGYLPELAFLA